MNSTEVIAHYRQVRASERQLTIDSQEELLSEAESARFDSTANFVRLLLKGFWHHGHQSTPRITHEIMSRALKDTRELNKTHGRVPKSAISFLSGSITARLGVQRPGDQPVAVRLGVRKHDACRKAERYFGHCITQIQTDRILTQPVINIYHTPVGEPVALGKTLDEATALMLRPISFEGTLILPTGGIVAIGGKNSLVESGQAHMRGFELRSYSVERPPTVSPARLSAFAYEDPLDRSLYALNGFSTLHAASVPKYDEFHGRVVERLELTHFRNAAATAMQLCGVNAITQPV